MAESVIYSVNSNNTVYVDATPVTLSLNISCISASATHTLEIKNGNTTLVTKSLGSFPAGSSTQSVSLTSSQKTAILNSIPNVASFTATYVLSTTLNNVSQGTSSCTGTMAVFAGTSAPDINTYTYADTNPKTVAFTGDNQSVVLGYSTITFYNVSGTAHNGASIKDYKITNTVYGNWKTYTSGGTIDYGTIPVPIALDSSTGKYFAVQVTDTRNFGTQKHASIPYVYLYEALQVSSPTVKRNASEPSEIDISFSGTYSNMAQNEVTASYKFKETTSSTYGADNVLTVTTSGNTFSCALTGVGAFAETSAYDIVLTVSDKITDRTYHFVLAQQNPLIAFRDEAVGMGMIPGGSKRFEITSEWSTILNGKNNNFLYMPYSANLYGQTQTAGFTRIARVTITGNNLSAPIKFDVTRRTDGSSFALYLLFNNESSTDPAFTSFYYDTYSGSVNNRPDAFVYKADTSIWDVYVRKAIVNDYMTVITTLPRYDQTRCDISYTNALMSSVPSGAIAATPVPAFSSTPTFTKTSGGATLNNVNLLQNGNICQLTVGITAPTTTAGTEILRGTFTGVPTPATIATGCNFYYGAGLIARLYVASGAVTLRIRVIAQDITSSESSSIPIVYFTEQ